MPAIPSDHAGIPVAAQKLDALRAELADLAYKLEKRGRLDAADIAIATAARLGEFRDELMAKSATTGRGDLVGDWDRQSASTA